MTDTPRADKWTALEQALTTARQVAFSLRFDDQRPMLTALSAVAREAAQLTEALACQQAEFQEALETGTIVMHLAQARTKAQVEASLTDEVLRDLTDSAVEAGTDALKARILVSIFVPKEGQ